VGEKPADLKTAKALGLTAPRRKFIAVVGGAVVIWGCF
jgi:hypothetical protein